MTTEIKTPYAEHLYLQARALEGDLIRESIARYPILGQRHLDDIQGYSFRCERYGDFLAVFIERNGKKFCTALNIGQTMEIQLHEGHPPDLNGKAVYHVEGAPSTFTDVNSENLPIPAEGREYKVYGRLPRERDDMVVIERDTIGSVRFCGHGYGGSLYKRVQTEVSRDAQDDHIQFRGIDTTLCAPAGCGAKVRDAILDAIKRTDK